MNSTELGMDGPSGKGVVMGKPSAGLENSRIPSWVVWGWRVGVHGGVGSGTLCVRMGVLGAEV